HVAEPEIAVAIGAQAERAGRKAGLGKRDRIFGDLAADRVETPKKLLAETRVPGDAVRIDNHIVGLDRFARQIVFGDDDARALAFGPRQDFQRIAPARIVAEIDRAEIIREPAINLHALIAALFHQP